MLMLGLSAIVTIAIYYAMDFDKATIVGMYSGSSTNTTALAGVIDMVNLKEKGNPITINHLVVGNGK